MTYQSRNIIEYTVGLVSEFATKFNLTDRQAFRYINFHKGILFLESNYGIIHTLDFNEAVDSLVSFCRKSGGHL